MFCVDRDLEFENLVSPIHGLCRHRPGNLEIVIWYRMKKIIYLLLVSSSCFAQISVEQKIFSPGELKQDLTFLFQKLEAIHPDLYHYTPKSKVDEARALVENELNQPMTRMAFARKVIPLISMLNDGHTSLTFPQEERKTFLKNGGKVFPLNVRIRENKFYITANYSRDSTLVKGSEILSINGVPAEAILNHLRPYISAELDFYRDIRVQQAFRGLLWFVLQWEDDYELTLEVNGERVTKSVAGITEKELLETYQRGGGVLTMKPYSYYKQEGNIGVLDFRSMIEKEKFLDFLDSTFTVIEEDKTKYLIIDIRNNGGGNSIMSDALFDYITSKPYKQTERMEIKSSIETRKTMRKKFMRWYMYPLYPFFIFSKQARAYLFKQQGSITVFDNFPLQTPKNPPNKFNGKTYLLTGHYTFSSANMLADAYKCYQMGTVVGEETGGVLTAFGDLIGLKLLNTQLQAWCSHKKFVHPCSDGLLHGVKPDVEIIPSAQDMATGNDPALEYIKKIASGN